VIHQEPRALRLTDDAGRYQLAFQSDGEPATLYKARNLSNGSLDHLVGANQE
jgi:hypothetical protein